MNTQRWNGKNIVITGASKGLGAAAADVLSARGATVVLVARHEEALDVVVNALRSKVRKAFGIPADVADKDSTHRISGLAAAMVGRVDVLIHNASTLGPVPLRSLLDTECEDLAAVLETNLVGPFRLTKALLPAMLLRQRGLVVNISTDAAENAYARWGGYAVSKAALDHLTRIFDEELKDQGVRFLAVDPGDMRTPMHFAAIPDADPARLRDPADAARRLIALIVGGDRSQVRRAL